MALTLFLQGRPQVNLLIQNLNMRISTIFNFGISDEKELKMDIVIRNKQKIDWSRLELYRELPFRLDLFLVLIWCAVMLIGVIIVKS